MLLMSETTVPTDLLTIPCSSSVLITAIISSSWIPAMKARRLNIILSTRPLAPGDELLSVLAVIRLCHCYYV